MFQPQKINPVLVQQPIIGVDMTQEDYNNLQQQGMLGQNLMPQQPQIVDVSPQTIGVGGAEKKGVDWAGALQGLGSYLSAAGQGINPNATTMGAGLSGAGDTILKHQQNIKQFQTMAPYYQQMGYDVSKLDPSRGGAGISTSPEEFVKMKSLYDYRNQSLELKETLGLLGDNTKRANLISKALNDGTITPQEARQRMQEYGITLQDMNLSNQTRNADVNQYLAPARKRYYESMPGLAQQRIGIQEAQLGLEAPYKQAQTMKLLEELGAGGVPLKERTQMQRGVQAVESQVDRFTDTFKGLPTKAESYTAGQARRLTGMQTPAEANFNSQRTLLFNKIARELGGEKGVLSDQDINRINEALPNLTDSYQQKQAKMQAVYDLMGDVKNRYGMTQGGGSRVQPFTPNVNLTPIPRNAIGSSQVRPRQTSKPKGKSKDPLGLGI